MKTFLRFGVIGIINTAIDFGIFNALIFIFGLPAEDYARYGLFKSISFAIAVTNSFFLNKRFVFQHDSRAGAHLVGKFLATNLIALALNAVIGSIVFSIGSKNSLFSTHTWANIAALSAVAVTFTFNFICYKFIVFKKS